MSQNGYTYGGHHPAHHPNNSPLINNQTPNSATYSMPPLQPGVPLLSTGPLGGPSTSGHLSHGLPSLGQQSTLPPPGAPASSHHPLSFYGDPYAGPYTPVAQQQQQQHHYAPQYVPRPISAASNHHHSPAPPNSSSVINSVTHSQQPGAAGPSAVAAAGLPIAADGSTHSNTAGSTPPPQPVTKARSSVACALCRKQKMKCEGPDKKPCRRCRAAGVECVFEAPPVTVPKPRTSASGATEAWVEAKLSAFDQRIADLEDRPNDSVSSRSGNDATVSDHERRIAALEAQLYALQLQSAQTPAPRPPPPIDFPHHQSPLHSLSSPQQHQQHHNSYNTGGTSFGLTSPANGHALPPFQPGQNVSLHSRYNSTSSLKHEVDSQAGGGGSDAGGFGNASSDYAHPPPPTKRWKGDEPNHRPEESYSERPDFISRGAVTEEEAAMCFDSYFLTFAATTPHPDQKTLTFAETRSRSPLYLATIVSIGARSLSRVETFHVALREALYIASEMFMPDDDGSKLITTLTLKALSLLGLYYSLPHHLLASGMMGYKIGLRTALDEFDELSQDDKLGKVGRILIGKGRMMFVAYLWSAFYTYQAGEPTCYDVPFEVLRRQLDILVDSPYADPVTDQVLRTNLEECSILHDAFKQLGDGMVVKKLSRDEIRAKVDQSITDLLQWHQRRADTMVAVSQWGDSQELKAMIPFHHGRQCLMRYIFRPDTPLRDYDRNDPKLREYAKMAMESAIVILRWSVESRIWMPFSIVGGYVHQVNIPAALQMLFVGARLFPSEADFVTIRPLLHRLLKQCDVTIRGVASTKKEVHRAESTKHEVLEFDRFAFESSGEDDDSNPSLTPLGGDDQPSLLVGKEIGQSLASFRMELKLWTSPLRCTQEDTY